MLESYKRGEISRRTFIGAATALGMTASMARFVADASAQATPGASPEATPAGTPAATPAAVRPSAGTENQTRGEGGELRILQWQAPSGMNAQTATGDKDGLASLFVSEPLMFSGSGGVLLPNLVKEVPSVENGLLAEDLTSVTYNLLEGVLWSDGTPFTAADVIFTWQWVMDPANNGIYQGIFEPIASIEAPDDLTVNVTFTAPNPTWSDAHTGAGGAGTILPRHILEGATPDVVDAFKSNPIGTGPYIVESFAVNDQVIYAINENYREPNKPFFSRVILKGGGDAASAARAVIETGEYDFAWNLAVEPEVLRAMEGDDKPGQLVVAPGTGIERININFSDPNTEVDGQRSEMNTPHPIFTDIAVRQAMSKGIDKMQIASALFFAEEGEPPLTNILSGIPSMESPNTPSPEDEFDPDAAKQILEAAGWVQDGDIRKKGDLELKIRYSTTVSQVRQKIQQIVKANLSELGFDIQLEQVDGAVFFDSAVGNDQSNTHFYTDINMFTSTVGTPPPVSYMVRWYAGADRSNIAQKSNGWAGRNIQRYVNPEYDALYEAAQTEANLEESAKLFIQMNDILYNDAAVIPLVRTGTKVGVSRRLNVDNIGLDAFEFDYWNIANWRTAG
jgi:peptide/nickel transport system substrate-binding protein